MCNVQLKTWPLFLFFEDTYHFHDLHCYLILHFILNVCFFSVLDRFSDFNLPLNIFQILELFLDLDSF